LNRRSGRLTLSAAWQESLLIRRDATLLVPIEVHYQDALVPGVSPWLVFKLSNNKSKQKWSGRPELNRRPLGPEPVYKVNPNLLKFLKN